MPIPDSKQFDLSPGDLQRLTKLIPDDWAQDSGDLQPRNEKLRRWYRLWRNASDVNPIPDEERSNFSIPLVTWTILAKLSKELDVLLGEESEISVTPIGKTDVDRVPKVKRWMNWRIKNSLKLFKALYKYLLQKAIFGTSIGFIEWHTKTRTVRERVPVEREVFEDRNINGFTASVPIKIQDFEDQDKEVVEFDGPEFIIENLEDWVVPVNATSLEDADHLIRRVRLSLDEILDMADEGKFDKQVVDSKMDDLKRLALGNRNPDDPNTGEQVTDEKKSQEGLPQQSQGRAEKIIFYNWFGKFRRMEKREGMGLVPEDRSQELVAFFSPDLQTVFGVSRLVDIYPDGRRPFVHSNGILDVNRFWGIGLAEILEPISREMDAFHRLAVSAGEGAIGPVIFGTPAAGQSLTAQKLEPYTFVPVVDPNSIKSVNLGDIQLQPYILFSQQLMTFTERLTALTDPQLGRQFDQPNAPRTFGQQALLQAESNVRLLLDIRLERESLRELLRRIWELDKRFLPPETFFRVTEEDPGDVMTKEDMQGSFDFDIGPVTAISNRAQKSQELLQMFALVAPLGMPQIAIQILRKILEKNGLPDVAATLPDLKELAPPESPETEHVRLLQGEDVDPHPLDNHNQHIAKHTEFRNRMENIEVIPGLTVASQNPGLLGRIDSHIAEHQAAASQKAGLSLVNAVQPGNGQQPVGPANGPNPAGGLLGDLLQPQQSQQPGAGTAQNELSSILNQGRLNLG